MYNPHTQYRIINIFKSLNISYTKKFMLIIKDKLSKFIAGSSINALH